MRIGAWKLCQLCRRPEPRSAEDIGTWFTILEIIGFCAAIVNAGLIAFTSSIPDNYTWPSRVWLFFSIGLLLFRYRPFSCTLPSHVPCPSTKFLIKMATPDIPVEVDIQVRPPLSMGTCLPHPTYCS